MRNDKRPFVDFRAIRARITMEQVLEHYGVIDTFRRSGSRLSGPCPIHQGTNPTQFRVDIEKNIWNCFSDCKKGGNVLDFISKKEDVPIHDAAILACEWFRIPLEEIKNGSREEKPQSRPVSPKPSPNANVHKPTELAPEDGGSNPPLQFRLEKLSRSHPYFAERGLTQETVIDFGLGYFTGNKGLMVGRVAIPIFNVAGEVVAYAGRWPGQPPADTPKYKLPPGFKKSQELFNFDRAIKEPAEDPLVIVEGFFDAIMLHQLGCRKVVALMGSSMSEQQEELIRRHTTPTGRVLLMLDEDDAGRSGRDNIAKRLVKFCFVKIHAFEFLGQQPESLSAQEIDEIIHGSSGDEA